MSQYLQLKIKQLERPIIAYALCFDDVMKTCMEYELIPYFLPFGHCWEFKYDPTEQCLSKSISFPRNGLEKYRAIGIRINKYAVTDITSLIKFIERQLSKNNFVFLHYDGFYCPWDTLQKKKRWHNNHIVIVLGIDWKKERFVVCDPYYMQEKQFVPFSQIKEASKFCYLMESEWYQRANEEEIRKRAFETLENEEPIRNMERFISDFSARIQNLEVDGLFDLDWVRTIEQGFMTRHYLWIFYRNLYINGRNNLHGFLAVGFFKCLQQWKECVVHSHKAVRKKKQNIYYQRFIDSFYKVLSIEKEIHRCIRNRNFSAPQVLSGQAVPFKANQIPFDLIPYFNSRACKTSLKDRIDADVTGEGEFILPTTKRFRIIKKDKIRYPVFLGEKLDHVRCSGQTLMLPSDMQWKGIACLVCSEWGCSQLLLTVKGERADYITDFIANDFSFEQENSICIGKSFLSGNKKDTILQKKVFFQSVYFGFPEDDCIKEIVVPDCPSLHLFSMVLMS